MFGLSGIGMQELIIVLAIILIIFGPSKLPQLSRAIGKSIRDFKRGLTDIKDDMEQAGKDDPKTHEPEAFPRTVIAPPSGVKPAAASTNPAEAPAAPTDGSKSA